jgi:hypothetical protein
MQDVKDTAQKGTDKGMLQAELELTLSKEEPAFLGASAYMYNVFLLQCMIILFYLEQAQRRENNSTRSYNRRLHGRGAKSNKQGKQPTAHKTLLVTHILNRPICSRAEDPASNLS